MKKQLLLSGALLLSMSAFSQKQTHLFKDAKVVEDKHFQNAFSKANMDLNPSTTANKAIGPVKEVSTPNSSSSSSASAPILNNVWYRISGSGNVYGFLVSASKPLNYQRILGAVSFIQRKSATYVVSPAGDSNVGSIVAYWAKNDASTNNLASWDSTLIYADATNAGRYPSGGIWNILPGNANTDLNKAIAVGSGPVTTGSGWVGSWYASKSLSLTPKNAAGPDEQFFANASPFNSATSPSMTKHDFPRYGFNLCDNGVYVAGQKMNDINGTTFAAQLIRGASISKGTFNSGVMVWTQDSIIPPTELRTDGSKLLGEPYLKFDPAGINGYAMFIGMRAGSPVGSSNRGMQPIVYKTTNGGAAWALVNGIDFNAVTPAISQLKNTMRAININTTVEAPWFWSEGIDMTIDANNKLHIIATAIGHASTHVDSMNYLSTWTTEEYHWPHVNTARPLIIDYYGDGGASPWNVLIIDSLDTEGPSSTSGEGGFVVNPWADPTPNNSVSSDSRIQITRSYDGAFLAYSWAETDTSITTSSAKWNEFPNIKVRAFRTCDGTLSTEPGGFNVTGATGVLAAVKDKAYFHYMSGEMKAGASSATSATFAIPFSVSSNPLSEGINPVSNYFAMTHVGFTFPSAACGSTITTGIASAKTDASESSLYPNPTENNFNVRLNLSTANDIAISVYNAIGQKVSETKTNGTIGENNVSMNMNNATAGVYFVKIKVGKTESTKKLVVQ
ncbi:MAG: T9SS type A sorting domain-containing protein [Bacteroidota bacterium]|nr:T9SS type A sorting domain-containing protein [Bacteroidota bacterium]